ncbi:MAG: O-antigen ligase family protein [Dehalococcoidia bacterium]|nr:O-antigen ligase family protein [Dehalococcoidia bacterium]
MLEFARGLRSYAVAFLPVGLWGILWLSLAGGNARQVFDPQSAGGFFHGIRAAIPLVAASLAGLFILYKSGQLRPKRFLILGPLGLVGLYILGAAGVVRGNAPIIPLVTISAAVLYVFLKSRQLRQQRFLFLGPLGLTALYGLAGLFASMAMSTNKPMAIYWAASYLSVPLVLWAGALGSGGLTYSRRIVKLIRVFLLLSIGLLFVAALLYLELGSVILDPSAWPNCNLDKPWLPLTRELLRPTGVGRLAALAALIAVSGMFTRTGRFLWIPVLLVSIVLLTTSGARTSMAGFGLAASLMLLLYAGRKAVVAGAIALVLFGPLVAFTDTGQDFLKTCMFRKWVNQSVTSRPVVEPATQFEVPAQASESVPPLPAEASESVPPLPAQASESVPPLPAEASESVPPLPAEASESVPPLPAQASESVPPLPAQETEPSAPPPTQPPAVAASGPAVPPPDPRETRASEEATPPPPPQTNPDPRVLGFIPESFFEFTGRTAVWADGWTLFKESPVVGYGFHADRLKFGTHMHNSFMQALVQTGFLGTIPLVAALLLSWYLLVKAVRNLSRFSTTDRHLTIQTAGIIAFFSVRTFTESPGSFFGVDWLLLAPFLLYLTLVIHNYAGEEGGSGKS